MASQLKEKEEKLPKVVLTFKEVRKKVDERIPDSIVMEIVKTGNRKKITEINKAAGEIVKAGGWDKGDARYIFEILGDKKVAELFVMYTSEFVEIARAAGGGGYNVFDVFRNEKIAELFMKHASKFVELARASKGMTLYSFLALGNEKIAGLFLEKPDVVINNFVEIANVDGCTALFFLRDNEIAELFVNHTSEFVEIAKSAGGGAGSAIYAIKNKEVAKKFIDYTEGRISFDVFMVMIFSVSNAAIELGRPLDYLHSETAQRKKYLDGLSTVQVVGLLCSNPEFFYTSSNHLLFDRLKKEINGNGFNYLISKFGLNDEQAQNFIFRALNYDRLFGGETAIANSGDTKNIMQILLKGIYSKKFDEKYFYLLANAIEKVSVLVPQVREEIEQLIRELDLFRTSSDIDERKRYWSLVYLQAILSGTFEPEMQENAKKSIFERDNYVGKDRKLTVLQIFDKEDTEKDHWKLSQAWFEKKYGKPKIGTSGELIYEDRESRVILFMGDNENVNQNFAREWISKNNRGVITFRGHSYSLVENLPYDIFGNMPGNFLFIPGSCGSARSTPAYMMENPNTDIRFFSNTSTGRGQVTNAIIDIILEQKEQTLFSQMLLKGSEKIEKNEGELKTIKVFSAGEALLSYINIKNNSMDRE